MKLVKLIHNPDAGHGKHSKNELVKMIERQGYKCLYASADRSGWDDIEPGVEILAIAGGDGTVKKVLTALLKNGTDNNLYKIGLLPLGTANNVANTLDIHDNYEELVASWQNDKIKKFDTGVITGLEEQVFFVEGVGAGIIPRLIKSHKGTSSGNPEKDIVNAQEAFKDIVDSYSAVKCELMLDGKNFSGDYISVEVMNIKYAGPRLPLNPGGDTEDGMFEVVLIREDEKEALLDYVQNLIDGAERPFPFNTIKAKEIRLSWDGGHLHIDDKIAKTGKSATIKAAIGKGTFNFLLP